MGYSKYIEDIIDRWVEDTRGPTGLVGPIGPAAQVVLPVHAVLHNSARS